MFHLLIMLYCVKQVHDNASLNLWDDLRITRRTWHVGYETWAFRVANCTTLVYAGMEHERQRTLNGDIGTKRCQ